MRDGLRARPRRLKNKGRRSFVWRFVCADHPAIVARYVFHAAINPLTSAGWPSWITLSFGIGTQGCALLVQICPTGCSQRVSSRVPGFTIDTLSFAVG